MDIVKQRKKRLMAWILALVLCVSMWQGSVYATEGDGSVSGGDLITTSGNTTPEPTPEPAPDPVPEPAPEYGVAMAALEEEIIPAADPVEPEIEYYMHLFLIDDSDSAINLENIIYIEDDVFKEWDVAASGGITIASAYVKNPSKTSLGELMVYSELYTGSVVVQYTHNIIQWYKAKLDNENPDNPPKKGDVISKEEATLDNLIVFKESDSNITSAAYAVLGKSVAITFWDGAGESGKICIEPSVLSQTTSGEMWSINLPSISTEYGLVSKWQRVDAKGSLGEPLTAGEVITGNYNTFEEEIKFVKAENVELSNEIQSGTYYLKPDKSYQIRNGKTWTVKLADGTTDGYTYGGYFEDEEYQTFYIDCNDMDNPTAIGPYIFTVN